MTTGDSGRPGPNQPNQPGQGAGQPGPGFNPYGQAGPHGQPGPNQPGPYQAGPYGHPGPHHPGPNQPGPYGPPGQIPPGARLAGAHPVGPGKPPVKKGALFAGLAILAVVAVGLFAVTFLLNKKEPLAVGDCIAAFEESGESRNAGELIPDPLDCADPEAEYKVLSLRSEDSDPRCIDVEGATQSISYTGADLKTICLMEKDADVSRNINTIEADECVSIVGEFAERGDCADPGAYRVLAVEEDPGIAPPIIIDSIPACRDLGFPEATYYYQWGVPDSYYSFGMDYQRALCLIEAN